TVRRVPATEAVHPRLDRAPQGVAGGLQEWRQNDMPLRLQRRADRDGPAGGRVVSLGQELYLGYHQAPDERARGKRVPVQGASTRLVAVTCLASGGGAGRADDQGPPEARGRRPCPPCCGTAASARSARRRRRPGVEPVTACRWPRAGPRCGGSVRGR